MTGARGFLLQLLKSTPNSGTNPTLDTGVTIKLSTRTIGTPLGRRLMCGLVLSKAPVTQLWRFLGRSIKNCANIGITDRTNFGARHRNVPATRLTTHLPTGHDVLPKTLKSTRLVHPHQYHFFR
jgi:hypothetical protein